jgi:hypothetical protein
MQTQGCELCHAIDGPPQSRHHLSEEMWLVALCHTEVARELTAFWVAMSSVMESVLGRWPGDTSRMEVVGDLVTQFQKVEDWC